MNKWEVIAIVCGAVLTTLLLIFTLYRANRMRQRLVLRNPSVIAFGIGQYDQELPPRSREINGTLNNLCGIEKDLTNFVIFSSIRMNYDVFPIHDLNQLRLFWTRQDIGGSTKRRCFWRRNWTRTTAVFEL